MCTCTDYILRNRIKLNKSFSPHRRDELPLCREEDSLDFPDDHRRDRIVRRLDVLKQLAQVLEVEVRARDEMQVHDSTR